MMEEVNDVVGKIVDRFFMMILILYVNIFIGLTNSNSYKENIELMPSTKSDEEGENIFISKEVNNSNSNVTKEC